MREELSGVDIVGIAVPQSLVYDRDGTLTGYTMHHVGSRPLYEIESEYPANFPLVEVVDEVAAWMFFCYK